VFKPIRLLNLLLGFIAALIAAVLVKTWVAPAASVPSPVVTKSLPEAEALTYNQTTRPPLAQFDVLLEKNPFKQPPPMPARPMGASPPPPPLPTLVGTILVGHERRAILSDKGKANIYAIGQDVAGGMITEIKEDRIIFKRGDATREILLKAAIESATAAPPAPVAAPVADQTGVSAQPPGPSQPPAPHEVFGGEEMWKRREERLRERRERRERNAAQRAMEQP
jgi:type II secretory pathway component PulC